MTHVVDGASPLGWLERAIKDRQVGVIHLRSTLDGSSGVDVRNDRIRLLVGVTKLKESRRDGVVDDLNHPAANQFLVLHQREIGLDAGSVAIHHESNRSCGS